MNLTKQMQTLKSLENQNCESCDESCTELEYLESDESQSDQEECTEEQNEDRIFLSSEKSIVDQLKLIHLRRVDSMYLWNLSKMWKQLLSFNWKQNWKLLHDLYIVFIIPKPCYILVNWSSFKSASRYELAYNFHNLKHRDGVK